MQLLGKVVQMVFDKGYAIANVDCTLIAQRPKLRPYIDDMRHCLAAVLGLDIESVSVKATTEERLGFTGREEGIAAHAVVLVRGRQ